MVERLYPVSKCSDFWGVDWAFWPPQTKIQNSGSTKSNDLVEIGLPIRIIFAEKRINRRKTEDLRYSATYQLSEYIYGLLVVTTEWTKKWMNEWTNERINEPTNE